MKAITKQEKNRREKSRNVKNQKATEKSLLGNDEKRFKIISYKTAATYSQSAINIRYCLHQIFCHNTFYSNFQEKRNLKE